MKNEPNHKTTSAPAIGDIPSYAQPFSIVYNEDCVQGMKRFPDKYFDLAIVDPPYGIEDRISKGGGSHTKSNAKFHQMYSENGKKWDIKPNDEYWKELFRVSKNQIVWGANYFGLPECRCFIVWDKIRYVENYSNLEYAWTSFDRHAKKFEYCNNAGFILKPIDKKIHPTQKPVALYDWLLENFGKCQQCNNEGMVVDDDATGETIPCETCNGRFTVLDTHLGSGGIRISCDKANMNFVGFEIDTQYFNEHQARFKEYKRQLRLF